MKESIHLKKSVRLGLIAFAIIFYLSILGLPKTIGSPAVLVFQFVLLLVSLVSLRETRDGAYSWQALTADGLIIGVVGGGLMGLVTFIFATLQAKGVAVADVLAQIQPEHTAALVGSTKAGIQQGANITGGLLWLVARLIGAALVGAWLTPLLGSKAAEKRAEWGQKPAVYWLTLALPFLFYLGFFALRLPGVVVAASQENIVGLVLIFFFIAFGLVAFRQARQKHLVVVSGLLILALIILPMYTDQFQDSVLGKIVVFVVVGLALNIVIGYAGMLHLGFVAFFAIGAYGFGLLSSPQSYVLTTLLPNFAGVNFWVGLVIAMVLGAVFGVLMGMPVLGLRGDYLAIVTLGFGEIIRMLLVNLRDYTGGPGGVLKIPPPIIAGYSLNTPRDMFYLGMIFVAVAMFVTHRLRDSRLGRAWMAMREDEDIAEAMGINLSSTKLLAFAFGGAMAAAAGVVYASQQVNIFPDNFQLAVSIDILSLVIIGGLGSVEGVVLGSVALIGMPEILRGVNEYRIVAFGILLIVMMILRPEGLLPSAVRQRELRGEEKDQDAWIKMAQQTAETPTSPTASTDASQEV